MMLKTTSETFDNPKRRKVSGMRCSVRFCKSKTAEKNVSFFNYPTDVERRALWIKACETQRKVSFNPKYPNSARVCGDHFEKHMFLNSVTRNRLVFNAVPTLFNDEILEQRSKLKKRTIYSELITDTDDEILSDIDIEMPMSSNESSLDISNDSIKMSPQEHPSLSEENSLNELSMDTYTAIEQNKTKQLQNAVILLSQQLTKYESEENILKFCNEYFSSDVFEMIKFNMDVKVKINAEIEEDKYEPNCE